MIWLTAFLLIICITSYYRAPLFVTTAALASAVGLLHVYGDVGAITLTIIWVLFLGIFIPLNLPLLRKPIISSMVFRLMKGVMPTISQTEQEALDAGDVWWEGELFSGKPDFDKIRNIAKPELTEEEQAFLDGPVDKFCEMIDDWKITQEDYDLTPQAWQFIKDNGFFAMIIPKSYGGIGYSALAHSSVVMKISGRSISAAVTVMVPNSLGPGKLLMTYGTEKQKNYYLPRLAKGIDVPCFGLTGPEAGSDAGAMPDNGIVCYGSFDGQDKVLGIRLNFNKRYITLAPVATLLGIAFKLFDPDHLLSDKKDIGITLALINRDTDGITIGKRHFPANQSFMNGPIQGKDVFIPIDAVIGGVDYVGKGWSMLMECLTDGRAISLPALSTSAGKLTSRFTGAYS